MLSWYSIRRNPLYYIVFGSKHISVSDAQKTIFSFTLITRHNTMSYDLESQAIAIKHCFGSNHTHSVLFNDRPVIRL